MQQRVCGQNKDNLSLHAVRTLIWRSCAFNRGPMTMPVLNGVKPMAITLPICGTSKSLFWKRKKSIYCWTRSRPTWTFGESDDQVRDKSESKYQRVQDKSETIEKRLESGLEYYSPTLRPLRKVRPRAIHHPMWREGSCGRSGSADTWGRSGSTDSRGCSGSNSVSSWTGAGSGVDSVSSWNGQVLEWTLWPPGAEQAPEWTPWAPGTERALEWTPWAPGPERALEWTPWAPGPERAQLGWGVPRTAADWISPTEWWRHREPSPRRACRTPRNTQRMGDLGGQGQWSGQRLPSPSRKNRYNKKTF